MLKKSLVLLSIFCVIAFSFSYVFAANIVEGTGNALRNVGNGVQNMVNATGDTLNDAKNGMANMMNDVGNGVERTVDGMEDGMREDNGENNMTDGTTDDGYTAARTGATDNMTGNGANTTLVWVILAVAAVAIIALVWYYMTQTNDTDNRRH